MHPQIEAMFDEAESRYLQPEELGVISEYVSSLPERLELYRLLRDREVDIMQPVADQLVAEMPNEQVEMLERSIKNVILTLRYCAMGVLLNDEAFVRNRLQGWLGQTAKIYDQNAIDTALYRLLNNRLGQVMSPSQMSLLQPMVAIAQQIVLGEEPSQTPVAIGW